MDEYLELERMSEITEARSDFMLSPHAVIKESSNTVKLRVAFHASVETSTGLSLNDVHYVGPVIQNNLLSIILRFRKYNHVMTADISKIYRRVYIARKDRHM